MNTAQETAFTILAQAIDLTGLDAVVNTTNECVDVYLGAPDGRSHVERIYWFHFESGKALSLLNYWRANTDKIQASAKGIR